MQEPVDSAPELATVAKESFEFNIVPWAGRKYEEWVRAWARRHPLDPGLVQVPNDVFAAFKKRTQGQRLTRQEAEGLGYPRVPGEQEMIRVRKELHDALGRGDWDRAHDLDAQLRDLQERVAEMRISALRAHTA